MKGSISTSSSESPAQNVVQDQLVPCETASVVFLFLASAVGVGSISNQVIVTKIICSSLASWIECFKNASAMLRKGSHFPQGGEGRRNRLIVQIVTLFAPVC